MTRISGLAAALLATTFAAWDAPALEAQQPSAPSPGRVAAERRVHDGIERLVRRRLQLDDAQFRQLQAVNARLAPRRQELWDSERATRAAIRGAFARGDTTSAGPLGGLVDRMIDVRRRRIELAAEEQQALARFLSPVQRARYLALQEQLHERVENSRAGRPGRRAGQGRPRG